MADLLGIQRLTEGNSFGVVCPFCGDARGKMNFRIDKDGKPANTYHCFCCGAKGNMLTLYAEVKGIYGSDRYKIAYREIKNCIGEIRREQGFIRPEKIHGPEEETASLEARDAVYRRMLSLLTLSEPHRNALKKRGLNEEQMEAFQIRSTPAYGTENLARKLILEGFSLAGIPGFFVNDRRNWDVAFYRRNKGFLCPAYSVDGKIAGFQIRLDEPYEDRKYLWLSSTNKTRGAGSKSPVTFLGNPCDKVVRVTEGILKPMIAYSLSGYSFLGTPGVNQYRELEKALRALKANGLEEVQEYMDMDKFLNIRCQEDYKQDVCADCMLQDLYRKEGICLRKEQKRNQIREGCMKLYEICSRLELRCIRKTWDQDKAGNWLGNYKGIDDYWCFCQKLRRELGG